MAANRHTYIHTHARAQCNHASVGLSQARPNYIRVSCIVSEPDPRESGSETISCTGSYRYSTSQKITNRNTSKPHETAMKCLGIQQNTEDTN